MNTNWAKILLFSLISFALGFAICCLCCRRCHDGGCEREAAGCHAGASACAHGGEGKAACCAKGAAGHGHKRGENPGDAEADAIVKELEKADFIGDTTIAIEGGEVRVLRSADNLSVHVDLKGEERIEKHMEHGEHHEHH